MPHNGYNTPVMASVAQLVRAPGCGSGGRGFKPHLSPQETVLQETSSEVSFLFCYYNVMKWIGITGSWRKSSSELESDLTREVTAALLMGAGIITGGALGVDYLATELTLQHDPTGKLLKVFLPTTLEIYSKHYRKRAEEGVITSTQAEKLIHQLETVSALGQLSVNESESIVDERTYYLRNTEVMSASNEIYAFQVNASAGTQDIIDKARQSNIPVRIFKYSIE